jgi:hypothetical protein
MLPASVRGDPRGEVFSSRGRGAIPRRGIPCCHPYSSPRAPLGGTYMWLHTSVMVTTVQTSCIEQKEAARPTIPQSRARLGGTYMWLHRTRPSPAGRSCPACRQPSPVQVCKCNRDSASPRARPFPVGAWEKQPSPAPAPPLHVGDRPADRQTRGRPQWRWLASASSTATVSCCRRSLRRRCGPWEVVALEPFDGMPLRNGVDC